MSPLFPNNGDEVLDEAPVVLEGALRARRGRRESARRWRCHEPPHVTATQRSPRSFSSKKSLMSPTGAAGRAMFVNFPISTFPRGTSFVSVSCFAVASVLSALSNTSMVAGVADLLLRATTSTRVTLVKRPLLQNG